MPATEWDGATHESETRQTMQTWTNTKRRISRRTCWHANNLPWLISYSRKIEFNKCETVSVISPHLACICVYACASFWHGIACMCNIIISPSAYIHSCMWRMDCVVYADHHHTYIYIYIRTTERTVTRTWARHSYFNIEFKYWFGLLARTHVCVCISFQSDSARSVSLGPSSPPIGNIIVCYARLCEWNNRVVHVSIINTIHWEQSDTVGKLLAVPPWRSAATYTLAYDIAYVMAWWI